MSTLFSAKVKGGVIIADDVDLPEGAMVTVVLDEAIAEADRGEVIPWETVRAELFVNR